MAAARVDPTARQIQSFATYCGAGSRKAAAQANELFGRREVAGRFGAARALGRFLTLGLLEIQGTEFGRRWPTTEGGWAASLTGCPGR